MGRWAVRGCREKRLEESLEGECRSIRRRTNLNSITIRRPWGNILQESTAGQTLPHRSCRTAAAVPKLRKKTTAKATQQHHLCRPMTPATLCARLPVYHRCPVYHRPRAPVPSPPYHRPRTTAAPSYRPETAGPRRCTGEFLRRRQARAEIQMTTFSSPTLTGSVSAAGVGEAVMSSASVSPPM